MAVQYIIATCSQPHVNLYNNSILLIISMTTNTMIVVCLDKVLMNRLAGAPSACLTTPRYLRQ